MSFAADGEGGFTVICEKRLTKAVSLSISSLNSSSVVAPITFILPAARSAFKYWKKLDVTPGMPRLSENICISSTNNMVLPSDIKSNNSFTSFPKPSAVPPDAAMNAAASNERTLYSLRP